MTTIDLIQVVDPQAVERPGGWNSPSGRSAPACPAVTS